jgi:predicted transcriptional regulator
MPHMIPQVVKDLAHDHELLPVDVRVWLSIADYLNMTDFTPLKLEVIADDVGMGRMTVSRSLDALVEHGYLERGARDGSRGPYTYRMPWQRMFPRQEQPRAA